MKASTIYNRTLLVTAIFAGERHNKTAGIQARAMVTGYMKNKRQSTKTFIDSLQDYLKTENLIIQDLLQALVTADIAASVKKGIKSDYIEFNNRVTKMGFYDTYRKAIANEFKSKYRIVTTVTGTKVTIMPSIEDEKKAQVKADAIAKKAQRKADKEAKELERHNRAMVEKKEREQAITTLPALGDYTAQRLAKLSAHYMVHAAQCGLNVHDSEKLLIEQIESFLVVVKLAHGETLQDATSSNIEKLVASNQGAKKGAVSKVTH